MAEVDGLQDPYLAIINISISEHINLYNKATVGLLESDRYDITISKWNDFYQELEDAVFIFGFKAAVFIVTSIYGLYIHTEVKDLILSYPYITQVMVDPHYEIL